MYKRGSNKKKAKSSKVGFLMFKYLILIILFYFPFLSLLVLYWVGGMMVV